MSELSAEERLEALLRATVETGASDLHLATGLPPYLRIEGSLAPQPGAATLDAEVLAALADVLTASHGRSELARKGTADGAWSSVGARFRFNVARRQGGLSIALRRLEDRFRSLEELGLPPELHELTELQDGLVVVAGPTGSGKSTTLATLIDRINRERAAHVITIEDPIEYLHRSQKALVNQCQVGLDVDSFDAALVAALRQDPDVILVGEVRELNTIRTAITAAETGHLVLTTVHAGDCVSAIERLIAVFPESEQQGIRRQLGFVLRAVIAQHLVPADGVASEGARRQRVLVSEVLRVNSAVANLVALGKPNQIYSVMETGAAAGNRTLESELARLWQEGRLSERTAIGLARSPQTVRDQRRARRGGTRRATGRAL